MTTRFTYIKISLVLISALLGLSAIVGIGQGSHDPATGRSDNSISLVAVNLNGTQINVGPGSGEADTRAGNLRARMGFTAAKAPDITIGEATATADAVNPFQSVSDSFLPVGIGDAVSGTVTLSGIEASVDAATHYARSTLGNAAIDAAIGTDVVELTNVDIGITNESSIEHARAVQGVDIESLEILPLHQVLDRVTNLSADDLTALAIAIGGDPVQAQLDVVEIERQAAITAINDLLPLGAVGLPSTTSVQGVLDYAAACGSDPLLTAICPRVTGAVTDLRFAMTTLEDVVGDAPLISVRALSLGVSASTYDTTGTASAFADWGYAAVAGVTLTSIVDPDAAMAALIVAVDRVEAALRSIQGLEGLVLDITPLSRDTSTSVSGAFQVAAASLSFLEVDVLIPRSSRVPTSWTTSVDVFQLSTSSMHRAAAPEPIPLPSPTVVADPTPSPSPTVTSSPTPDPDPSPSVSTSPTPDPDPSPDPTQAVNLLVVDPSPSPSASPSSGDGEQPTEVLPRSFENQSQPTESKTIQLTQNSLENPSTDLGRNNGSCPSCKLANTGMDWPLWLALGLLLTVAGMTLLTASQRRSLASV